MRKILFLTTLFLTISMTSLLLSSNFVLAVENFDSTAAEEEGYWTSRYNMGTLAMRSGLGVTFMPDMQMMMQAMQMVDADLDPTKMDTNYGDNDHPVPPTNPLLLQAVYKSGDPHYTQQIDLMDFSTQKWDPSTFDTTLTGSAQGFLMIKEVEWAKQFHVDDHFGTPGDDFGAQWRFVGMVLVMESKMQGMYFLQNKDSFDLSNGGDYVMLWALSDLGKILEVDKLAHSSSNRYKNLDESQMFLDAADSLFDEIKGKNPSSISETSLAIQSFVWYAASTNNRNSSVLLRIRELSDGLKQMNPQTAAEIAYSLRGLIEAKRVLGLQIEQIPELSSRLFDDFDDTQGFFKSQAAYTIDDVAAIVGALNAIRTFEGAEVDTGRAEEIFTNFFETVVDKSGLQQSAPPLTVSKSPFETEGEPEIFFRYPDTPFPPMAGGQFGIAPVFATSVKYENGEWLVTDGRFDAAGAMHASNEMIWLHYDEISGFPDVDVLSFQPENVSNVFFMNLTPGLNMISLPLKPITPYSARSFAEEISATMVIKLDETRQQFVGFTLDAPDDGFDIEGGKGYIVNVPEAEVVAFTGAAWINQPPVEAAPILTQSDGAWAFVVSGGFAEKAEDGYRVTIRNRRTNAVATDVVREGYFAAAFADLNRKNVVEIGDSLEVTVRDSAGEIVSSSSRYTVTAGTIRQAFLPITLKNIEIPRQSLLLQNYPNPFNPETWIPYQLAQDADVVLKIYDVSGKLVRTLELGHKTAGYYLSKDSAVYWDGKNSAGEPVVSGTYFYYLKTGDFTAIRKLVILK